MGIDAQVPVMLLDCTQSPRSLVIMTNPGLITHVANTAVWRLQAAASTEK